MNESKRCPYCQTELLVEAKFCRACGAAQPSQEELPNASTPPYMENTVPPYVENSAPPYMENSVPPYMENSVPPYMENSVPPYMENTVPPYAEKSKKSKKWIFLALGTGLVIVAVIAAFFFLKEGEGKEEAEEKRPSEDQEVVAPSPSEREETTPPEESDQTEEAVEPEEPKEEPEPAKGVDTSGLVREQVYVSSALSSSTFPAWQDKTYGAENTLDGNTDTAWVENAEGIGVGEWIEHQFGETEVVQEIQFYNGYGGAFEKNGVSSRVAISLSGGETFLYSVVGHWNTLVLPYALESSSVRITILEAFSSGDQDTCISELMIFNKSDLPATPLVEDWDAGVYGALEMSTEQAMALKQKVLALVTEAETNETGTSEYTESIVHSAAIFDGGNGVPVLCFQTYYYLPAVQNQDYYQVSVWEWDGKGFVSSVAMEIPTCEGVGVSRVAGNYCVYFGQKLFSGPPILADCYVGFEKGRATSLLATEFYFPVTQEEMNDAYIQQMLNEFLAHPFVAELGIETEDILAEAPYISGYPFSEFESLSYGNVETILAWLDAQIF